MVGSPPPTAEFLSKTVEELPERYIMKGGILDASPPVMDIPVIDVDLLSSLSNSDELDKLQSALQTWGCFQAVNHGIPNSFLDKVHEITKQFFALPMKEKQKYCRDVDDIEGYGNDMILYEDQILDWCDRLYLTVRPEDHQKLKFWPENPQTFREILHEYTEKTRLVNEVILKAMARSLKLEENCFLDQYGERATMYARFNFYPPCPRPDLVLGLKAHADGSAITIVLQDKEVEGLQFLVLAVLLLESDHSSAFHQESTLIAYIVTVMKRVVLRIPPKNFFTIKSLEQD